MTKRRAGVLLVSGALLTGCQWVFPASADVEITCGDTETTYCQQIVDQLLSSPPPGHGDVDAIVVRCLVNPPCAADRLDSEGIAVITMEDGFQWDQGFGPGMGI